MSLIGFTLRLQLFYNLKLGISGGGIAGITVGASVVFILLAVLLGACIWRYYRRRSQKPPNVINPEPDALNRFDFDLTTV